MKITDLRDLDILKEGRLLAGKRGLKNEILNATLIDAPDGYKWCKEGDFILSTCFPFIEEKNWEKGLLKLLKILTKKKCSGIGIKFGRYIPYLTDEIITFANRNKFPIISIPDSLKWSDIIVPIVTRINKYNQFKLKMNQRVYTQFHNFLKNQEDLNQLVNLLERIVKCPVTIYLRTVNEKIETDKSPISIQNIDKFLSNLNPYKYHTTQSFKKWGIDFSVRLIINSEENLLEGAIFLWRKDNKLKTWERIAIEQASVIVALEIERLRNISNTYQKLKNDFLAKIVSKDSIPEVTLNSYIKNVNWYINEYNRVILLDWDNHNISSKHKTNFWTKKTSVLEEFNKTLKITEFKDIPFGFDRNNRFLIIVPKEFNINKILDILKQIVKKLNISHFYAGIGKEAKVNQMYSSYTQAETALNVAYHSNFPRKKIKSLYLKYYEELHIERILFSTDPIGEVENFASYLDRIIEYDRSKNGELMATLRAFLSNNCNFDDTAKELFVHSNTIRYRINMIYKLTNLNPLNTQDQLILYLSLVANMSQI